MKKTKLYLVLGLVAVIVIGVVAVVVIKSRAGSTATTATTTKNRVREEVNVLPVKDRPVVKLEPAGDSHSVVLTVVQMKKTASTAEYELEYQAGTLLQGAFGQLSLATLPAQTKILLGSCSAGGACTYHKDVKGGKLLTRYQGSNNYTLKSDWRYIENLNKSSDFSSQDAKFTLSGKGLTSVGTAIILNAPGYPDGLRAEPVADIYSLSTVGTVKGDLIVSIRLTSDQTAQLAYFDGQTWHYVAGQVADKTLTATAPAAQIYTAVAE